MSISRRDLYAMGEPFGDSATQAKAGGGRIYGGGGGGGGSDTVSTQIVDLPAWATEYGKAGLGKAEALTDIEQNPYKTYAGDRTAGFSGLQQTAMQNAYNMGPSAGTNQAMGLAGAAGLNALNTQYDPASFNVNQLQTGSFTQPGAASAYMDPYMQNVVDIQKREAQNQADIAGTGRNAQAVKAGAFGGSRQAIMDAEAQRNLAQQMGDIQAKGSSAAYNQAMQQFNAEQQLGLTAQTGNQQQNLEAQKLVEQSRQYGAGQGMQGLQTALTGAGQLANIGQQQFGQDMSINQLQNQYGAQQQALQQQGLDTQYQDFLNNQRYPYQQLEFMNSILRGTPMGTVQSMYQPAPTAIQNLGSLGMTAAGIGSLTRAQGGEIPGYKSGGEITGGLGAIALKKLV
jgi:hypothetical protein